MIFLSIFSGETIQLECSYSGTDDDVFTQCQWSHVVDDEYVSVRVHYHQVPCAPAV